MSWLASSACCLLLVDTITILKNTPQKPAQTTLKNTSLYKIRTFAEARDLCFKNRYICILVHSNACIF